MAGLLTFNFGLKDHSCITLSSNIVNTTKSHHRLTESDAHVWYDIIHFTYMNKLQ